MRIADVPVLSSVSLHPKPDLRRHPCVVEGAVALADEIGAGEEVQVDRLQGVVGEAGKLAPAHLQGADVTVGEAQLHPGEFVAQEGDLESGVVGDEDAVRDEGIKAGKGLLRLRLAFEHLPGDPVDCLDAGWDRDAGVDERREFLRDDAVFYGDGADLDDPVALAGMKPRGFEIDDDVPVERAWGTFHIFLLV